MEKSRDRKALERLTTPDHLDRLLVVIKMPGWIALLCVLALVVAILIWSFFGRIVMTANATGIYFQPEAVELIQSRQDGYVTAVRVQQGDEVKKGDVLVVLNPEANITAPSDGTVLAVEVLPGEAVSSGKNLVWFQNKTPSDSEPFVYSFFPIDSGGSIKPGMEAQMDFTTVNTTLYGKMKGKVVKVLPFSATLKGGVLKSIPSERLKEYLVRHQASLVVVIEPIKANTPSGYEWTTPQGPNYQINLGAVTQVEVFLEKRRPIDYLIPLQASK